MKEFDIIEQIKAKNQSLITRQFNKYKDEFIRFYQSKSNLDEDILNDLYINAFNEFYSYVIRGKLITLTASIKTILVYRFGWNIVHNYIRDNKRFSFHTPETFPYPKEKFDLVDNDREEEKRQIVRKALQKLKDNCRKLLKMIYWDSIPRKDIASILNKKSASQVGVDRHRCLERLEGIIVQMFLQSNIY